jgi:HSP20 family protein
MDEHERPPDAGSRAREPGEGDPADNFSTPAADVFETAGEIVVLIDVPGVDADDLDVDLHDGSLTVTARRKELEDRGAAILSEYQRRGYFRYFRVPKSVEGSRITATLADGVLRLVLPKAGRLVPRKIPLRID